METPQILSTPLEISNSTPEITANGTSKRKRESDHSDDEKDFLGFDSGEFAICRANLPGSSYVLFFIYAFSF